MSRQWIIAQINKINSEGEIPKTILLKDGFLYQPKYDLLRTEFDKYKLKHEEWHQMVRFALSNKEEHRYIYARLLHLLLRHRKSFNSYFKLRTESGTVLLPDRIMQLSKLLSMYKDYLQIFKMIVRKIKFDYPMKKYIETAVRGKIDWNKTLKKTMGFPLEFELSRWYREFDVPENILLLLAALWLNADAKKIIHLNFVESLVDGEISILNYIIQKTKNIITFFPFTDVLSAATRLSTLSSSDKRIARLQESAEFRLNQSSLESSPYRALMGWIKKYKRLNFNMISPFTANYPLETLENIDTIYEAWIFFEFVNYFSKKGLLLELEIDMEPNYFTFNGNGRILKFFYERRFLKNSEHAWAVESFPDFTVTENDKVIAVFDAKNYGASSSGGEARHKMLAYMSNLDCGFGGLFFPHFDTVEYKFPRTIDKPIHHFNLLFGEYNMKPAGSPEESINKNEIIAKIHSNLSRFKKRLPTSYKLTVQY